MAGECHDLDCDTTGTIPRVDRETGEIVWFCGLHDPLDDGMEDYFADPEEVPVGS